MAIGKELVSAVQNLKTRREQHLKELAEIEGTFQSLGMGHLLQDRKRPGRTPRKSLGKSAERAGNLSNAKTSQKRMAKPQAPSAKGPGRPAGLKKRSAALSSQAPRTRGKYEFTGAETILGLLAKKGNATTAEIRQHWVKLGRKGKPENQLTGLVQSGKVQRTPLAGKAGSTYSIPSSASAQASP